MRPPGRQHTWKAVFFLLARIALTADSERSSELSSSATSSPSVAQSTITSADARTSSPIPAWISTCQSRTLNYITHTLPQQCLKANWTRSSDVLSTTSVAASTELSHASGTSSENNSGSVHNFQPKAYSAASQHGAAASVSVGDVAPPSAEPNKNPPAEPTITDGSNASSPPDRDTDADSLLDNAAFLSFEEWKKRNLAKIGQPPENAGQGRKAGADARRPPLNINHAFDSLGDETEIELDFGAFRAAPTDGASASLDGGETAETAEGRPAEDMAGPTGRGKDAGITCKERFNYASFDCAATILKTNPRCKSSSSVLVESKDSYMLNECAMNNKFIIVELCDDILIDTVVLANFEFFSSTFRTFRVSVSNRYPVKLDRWRELGTFEARNSRDIQAFAIENPLIWTKYLRIEFLTHYGNEYYCPVSLLRVHGTTMMEEVRHQEDMTRDEDEPKESTIEPKDAGVHRDVIEEVVARDVEPTPDIQSLYDSGSLNTQLPSAVNTSETSATPSARTDLSEEPSTELLNVFDSQHDTVLRDSKSTSDSSNASEPLPSDLIQAQMVSNASMNLSDSADPTLAQNVGDTPGPSTEVHTTSTAEQAAATVMESPAVSAKAIPTASESLKPQGSHQSPPTPAPSTQESFFKSLHKRVQMLESNSTLSLQYIEEQSRILRDAFSKVEKKQAAKAEKFLEQLNDTVIAELKGFRTQYDQLWQSTVLELESHREAYQRENAAISSRLTIIADELVWQKRITVVQSTLLLFCLGLVVFGRSGSISMELPLMQQMLNKSHSMLRLPFDSPPGSPSSEPPSRAVSPPSKRKAFRRLFRRPIDQDSEASLISPVTAGSGCEPPSIVRCSPASSEPDVLEPSASPDAILATAASIRHTQSGPATPSGSREHRTPLDWDDDEEIATARRTEAMVLHDAEELQVSQQATSIAPAPESGHPKSGGEDHEAKKSDQDVGRPNGAQAIQRN